MKSDLLSRAGTFSIDKKFLRDNPETVTDILKDVLIVAVNDDYMSHSIIYKGYSKHFDIIDVNEIVPVYIITVYHDKSIKWNKEKEYTEKDVKGMMEEILNYLKGGNKNE